MYSNSDDFAEAEAGEVGGGAALEASGTHHYALLAGMGGEFAKSLGVGAVDEERMAEIQGQVQCPALQVGFDGTRLGGAAKV